MSHVSFRRAVVVVVVVLSLALAAPALATDPAPSADPAAATSPPGETWYATTPPDAPWYVKAGNGAAMAFDAILLRPLGLGATIGGFACNAIALPFSAINRDITTPWEIFVLEPADYTFQRPLGDF